MYFVVLLPDGMVVEPKFAQRLKLRLPKSDIGPTMNLTAEQVQRAVSPDGGKERRSMESLFHRQYVRIAFPPLNTWMRLPGNGEVLCALLVVLWVIGSSWALGQGQTTSTPLETLEREFTDPLTTLPQVFLKDAFSPVSYGT